MGKTEIHFKNIERESQGCMNTTTGRIYTNDMEWAKNCMDVLGIKTFPKFFKRFRRECKLGRQRKFYDSLPDIQKKQQLKGKRIQKQGASFG